VSRSNNTPGRSPSEPSEPSDGGRGWVLPLVVAALVVAVFVLISVAKRAEKTNAGSEPAPAAPAEPVAAPVTNPPVHAAAVTAVNASSTNPAAPLKLQGIVFDAAQPGAIVDGKTYHVGDRVRGYRVLEITPSTLTLEDTNGSSRTLFLGK